MNVEQFLERYNVVKDKDDFVKTHITNNYVSYSAKIDECREIIKRTSYKELQDKTIYWKNTPTQYLLFIIRLFTNYTDIELGEGADILKSFDTLNRVGLINRFIQAIPQSEYSEWRNILEMCDNDEYENVRSLPSFIETKMEAMKLSLDVLNDALADEEILQ